MMLAAGWSARWARQISRPLEQMALTMRQVEDCVQGLRPQMLLNNQEFEF